MQYTDEQSRLLICDFMKIKEDYQNKLFELSTLKYNEKRANEFLQHGFLRRFSILIHCIAKVFEIYPPERIEILTRYERLDIEIYIQTFIINLYGAIDNLAWIVNAEKQLKLDCSKVSLYCKKFKSILHKTLKHT